MAHAKLKASHSPNQPQTKLPPLKQKFLYSHHQDLPLSTQGVYPFHLTENFCLQAPVCLGLACK